MPRKLSHIASDWWDYTTPDSDLISDAARLTEQFPLVARLVNELGLSLKHAHFWGIDEWYDEGTQKEVASSNPLSFEKADRELCFDRIQKG